MNLDINDVIKEAEDALNTFDNQAALVNSFPFPIELYELIYNMLKVLYSVRDEAKPQDEDEPMRYTRLAVEELSDRLGDAISQNIQLAVELRARDELVVTDNKSAHQAFMSDVLNKIFTDSKGTTK